MTEVYKGNTLIQLVQYDVNHQEMSQLRQTRSLQQNEQAEQVKDGCKSCVTT